MLTDAIETDVVLLDQMELAKTRDAARIDAVVKSISKVRATVMVQFAVDDHAHLMTL